MPFCLLLGLDEHVVCSISRSSKAEASSVWINAPIVAIDALSVGAAADTLAGDKERNNG